LRPIDEAGTAGAVGNYGAGDASVTGGVASIENAGGGWYRCILAGLVHTDARAVHFETTSGQNVLIWGAQLELGSVATPYQANATTPNGAFIPGRIGTGLDAAGSAKTLAAGKHGNPYSLLVRNPWSTPELVNIGIPSSNKIAPSVDVQAASVVDTQFNRILSTGSDRYLAYRQALTGADKTNTEGYTT